MTLSRSPALAAMALAIACSPQDEPILREPRVLRFSPAHPALTLRLTTPGDDAVALTRIRIDPQGPDWGAFTITDTALPRRVEVGEAAELHLRVDLGHFGDHHAQRPGEAVLTLQADKQPIRVRLQFVPDPPPDPATWPRRLLLAALAGLAAARHRSDRSSWTTVVPALVFLAAAPIGSGLCTDLLGDPETTADLLQCADGRGGFAVQLLAHPDALGLALAVTCLSGLFGPSTKTWRGLALALFAALVALGSLDPQVAVHTQAGLRWGLWVQPLGAAALTIAALVHIHRDPSRLGAIGLAALLTTLALGGPDLGLSGLPHAASVAAGLAAWLGKLALVAWGLRRLSASDRPPAWLARLVLPLAAAQILASVLTSSGS